MIDLGLLFRWNINTYRLCDRPVHCTLESSVLKTAIYEIDAARAHAATQQAPH
jgi:hypothetical protein